MRCLFSLLIAVFSTCSFCSAQVYQESDGLVVMEMENTTSAPGLWQEQASLSGFSGSGYLQFLGNTFTNGPANSPLEYTFKINQAGLYYLHMHCAKETHDGRTDVANDCYVRVDGDYNAGPGPHGGHGDNASLSLLQSDTKYFGGATNRWKWENGQNSSGGNGNLDPGGHANKRVAVYDFKAGETYTLVVSGRSKFFRINRLVFRHASTSSSVAQNLSTPESETTTSGGGEEGGGGGGLSLVYDATTDFPDTTSGDIDYYVDNGNDALAIAANIVANRTGFARATRTFDGPTGTYDVTITTMTEEDGESIYRLLVNGVQVRTFTNPFVYDPPNSPLDLQPHTHTWPAISIPNGATIAIESNADSNDLVSEAGNGNPPWAWARGRWQQIELATSSSPISPPAGRIAYVADGNSPDPDDIGANAVVFGLLGRSGLRDRLVHFSHSCDLDPFSTGGSQSIDAANEQRRQDYLHQTAGEGIGFFGPFPNLVDYYNCRTEQTAAVNDLRDAINASSASDPLWIIEAGEPDVIGFALQAANAAAIPHVHVVSHHPANDNSGDFFTWQQILDFGVTEHQIGDQNVGLQVLISSGLWDWAEGNSDPAIVWILDQLKYAEADGVVGFQNNKYDCSDAGMIYWWLTGANFGGNNVSTPVEIRDMLLYEPGSGVGLPGNLVAGWDTWDNGTSPAASFTAAGVSGVAATTSEGSAWHVLDGRGASADGDWGTFAGPPTASTVGGDGVQNENLELSNATTGGTITFTITNNGTTDIELDGFHFDAYAFRPKAARAYELSVTSGDITNGVIYTSADDEITDVGGAWDNNAHDDISHSLLDLTDHTLEAGGTVSFLLAFSSGFGDDSGGHDLWVDNVAITGTSGAVGELLGDFDNDGDVELDDLDQYNGNIGSDATGDLEALDLNNDGDVGADDFATHYGTLVETSNGVKGTFAGDINLDGVVDVLGDAFALVGNLGNNSATSWSQGDLNADGMVDVLGDAFLLVGNLGRINE